MICFRCFSFLEKLKDKSIKMGKDKKRHNSSESDDSTVRKRDRY